MPLLNASEMPLSGSLIRTASLGCQRRRMSMVPSVEAPSMTMCSMARPCWLATEDSVASIVATALRQTVTTDTIGKFAYSQIGRSSNECRQDEPGQGSRQHHHA